MPCLLFSRSEPCVRCPAADGRSSNFKAPSSGLSRRLQLAGTRLGSLRNELHRGKPKHRNVAFAASVGLRSKLGWVDLSVLLRRPDKAVQTPENDIRLQETLQSGRVGHYQGFVKLYGQRPNMCARVYIYIHIHIHIHIYIYIIVLYIHIRMSILYIYMHISGRPKESYL